MSMLFTPITIGALTLPNRIVRSATAERMADAEGRPQPQQAEMYRELVRGEVGLIVTGHMYVHPGGKAHPEMTGAYSDALIPDLARLAESVHEGGGLVMAQINHGGMQCKRAAVEDAVAPSDTLASTRKRPARAMTVAEIEMVIDAYAQAARRVKEAGFDGVQLHAAHGYLISQFLSPFVNKRTDEWGGDLARRMRFLRAACEAVRAQVGPEYPLWAKLGMQDAVEGGLTLEEGAQVVAALQGMGLECVEVSIGVSSPGRGSMRTGIRTQADEAYFRPMAQQARKATRLPIALVGGFRTQSVMEEVLASGDADCIALCRPLICEPDLPRRMRLGLQQRSVCISTNQCWSDKWGEPTVCRCPVEKGSTARG